MDYAIVIVLLTALAVFGLGWEARGCVDDRRGERQAARPVPYRLTLHGYQATSPFPFQGRADAGFQLAMAEYDVHQDKVSAEVDEIWRQITGDPGWQRWAGPPRDRS